MQKLKPWIQAARLHTLPLSVSGIATGTLLAAATGEFDISICVAALITTLLLQILANFANDYGDAVKGTDNEDRKGPPRAVQSGRISHLQMYRAVQLFAALSLLSGLFTSIIAFGWGNSGLIILFILFCIVSVYSSMGYTMGEKPYGYRGMGDLSVFLFFGWLSVAGSYFLYTKHMDWTVLLPASSIGMLSSGVLNLNNMRDYHSDKKAGKRTIVVKMGSKNAKYYHYFLLSGAILLAILYAFIHSTPLYFLITLIPLSAHLLTVYKNKKPEKLNPELKKLALTTFVFAILFGLSDLLA